MTEFVEQRRELVDAEQRGRALVWLGHVEHVHDDRLRREHGGLIDDVVHPRPTALGGPREVVAQEQPDAGATLVEHLPDPDVWMVGVEVGALPEAQPIQLSRRVEHAVGDHGVEFAVVGETVEIDLRRRLTLSGKPVGVIRSGDLGVGIVRVREFGQGSQFGATCSHGGGDQLTEQIVDRCRIGCGLLGDDVLGVIAVPQQLGSPRAQPDDLEDGLARVELVAARAPSDRGIEYSTARRGVVEFTHHGLARREFKAHKVSGIVACVGCCASGGRDRAS